MNEQPTPAPPPAAPAPPLNLSSSRARQARFAERMRKGGASACTLIAAICGVAGGTLVITGHKLGNLLLGFALFSAMWVIWYRSHLKKLAIKQPAAGLEDILDPKLLSHLRNPTTPRSTWQALTGHWQEVFLTNRLLLDPDFVRDNLSDREVDMATVWQLALQLRGTDSQGPLYAGTVCTALILSSPQIQQQLTKQNLKPTDVLQCYDWLTRLIGYQEAHKPYFGGIGRDWAFGFTPNLERFSTNLSMQVERGGGFAHFMSRSSILDAVINNLERTGGVALVGDTGIGKSTLVSAMAQRLFQGQAGNLKDHQIVSLNASAILSVAKNQLEGLMLTLFSEAIRAGNMILFLDEAQLFFKEGTGSFDMSQILLPVLQNRRLKLITAFNSTDYQRLKNTNPALAAALVPVVIQEPSQTDTYKIIEDSSLLLEQRSKTVITYAATREAYRLSGQYIQDLAYPGKAITLLEQAAPYAVHNVISEYSVQQAIESTLGVKAGSAQGDEAANLLNLEEDIHKRMINQVSAVKAVAAALRRARAGVGNSKRPIGSFLFLGPTGVGKTELARSLAATYYGDERNMIRLDMSEYQQASDSARLLDSGSGTDSLILAIRKQPFSVVLLDEIEKAHSSILNLLLQLLDEGQLTDMTGKPASFRNAIIIVTSNAGSADILARIQSGQSLDNFDRPLINQLIQQGVFRAELINRFDETVLFRPLKIEELMQVAQLMLGEVNRTLVNRNISVELTAPALQLLVQAGYDPQFGARPMRRVIQRTVEDVMATKILSGQATSGSHVVLDVPDLNLAPQTSAPTTQGPPYTPNTPTPAQ